MVGRAQPVADVAGCVTELRQVLPDAEAAAGARDDDGAHLLVARFLQRGVERPVHRAVERVQDAGPVERDREDGAVALRFDLRHGATLLPEEEPGAELVRILEHEAVLARAVRRALHLGDHRRPA